MAFCEIQHEKPPNSVLFGGLNVLVWLGICKDLFDDQAAGWAKGVYLAIITDDAAFGGEQSAAYGNDFGFSTVSLVRLQGAYHFDIQIDGAKIDACFQHGVYCTAGDGVDDGGVKAAMHAAQSV